MAANPSPGHGVAGLSSGLPVFDVAGTSVGIRILAPQSQQTPLGGGLSVQRAAPEVSVSLSRFPSLSSSFPRSLPLSLSSSSLSYSIFCVYDTDECCYSSREAFKFC